MRSLSLALVVGTLLIAQVTSADDSLLIHEGAGPIRIDGVLREWNGVQRMALGRGGDAELSFAFSFDSDAIYFGAEVRDERFIRSAQYRESEDVIVVSLAPDGCDAKEFWLYAGVPGRIAGKINVKSSRGTVASAEGLQLVEAPRERGGGYTLEAKLPIAALGCGDAWKSGRVAVVLRDVDSEARPVVERELSTGPHSLAAPSEWLAVMVPGGQNAALRDCLAAEDLEAAPRTLDLRADLDRDGKPERLVGARSSLCVVGGSIAGYAVIRTSEPIRSLELGPPWLVHTVADGERPATPTAITEWNDRTGRRLELHNGRLQLYVPSAPRTENASSPSGPARENASSRVEGTSEQPGVVTASEPTAGPLAVRARRGLDAFLAHANLNAADVGTRKEFRDVSAWTVAGRYLVVIGPGVGGGGRGLELGFVYLELAGLARDFDVADLDRDGAPEFGLSVRTTRSTTDGEAFEVTTALCYSLVSGQLQRRFAAEVEVRQGDKAIRNNLVRAPVGLRFEAQSMGWTRADFPFQWIATEGIFPIAFPWDVSGGRYVLERAQPVRRELDSTTP